MRKNLAVCLLLVVVVGTGTGRADDVPQSDPRLQKLYQDEAKRCRKSGGLMPKRSWVRARGSR